MAFVPINSGRVASSGIGLGGKLSQEPRAEQRCSVQIPLRRLSMKPNILQCQAVVIDEQSFPNVLRLISAIPVKFILHWSEL